MRFASVDDVERALREEEYLPERGLATAVFLALEMERADRRWEAFCFGTRLTRITTALATRRPDEALRRPPRTSSTGTAGRGSATR